MRILYDTGDDDLARVFVAELDSGARVEMVESLQPPRPREDKWVLIVSTLDGCPVRCSFCDAGGSYQGKLSAREILAQIEFLVRRRYPDGVVPSRMLKVQLARMGEPALNPAVLDALQALPTTIQAPGLLPSLSTVAPASCEPFFERLIEVKQRHYAGGRFQMQLSLHTTDPVVRRRHVPVRAWSMAQMAAWGDRFFERGDRKITLNFATARGWPLSPEVLLQHFSPERYLVKLTPINPTRAASDHGLAGMIDPHEQEAAAAVVRRFQGQGYDTILSIGELDENRIGSNCGMYLARVRASEQRARGRWDSHRHEPSEAAP